ncbi:DUF1285 domain-containing protein [Pseudogemmobacter sonorensis]|uniref:DUF1285 domain-containing protein n=1 Tax=Pseudogemmobacter sonorensis TaxID=2989681 RepID=UPI00369526B5
MTDDSGKAPAGAARKPPAAPDADALARAARAGGADSRGLPPVHLWDPPFCGDIDMRIARDGSWHYLGTPIGRPALVRLFSTILKREEDRYFLVTPVEKVGIIVDDAPFLADDFTLRGAGRDQVLTFATRTGDSAAAGAAHPLRFERDAETAEPSPYVLIRDDLWARIDRKSFYRLADLACHEAVDGRSWFGLWSSGRFFPMILSSELS